MATLKYLGRNSFKITTSNHVIYLDPYAGDDYFEPADFILVTHQHSDHNQTNLVRKKSDYILIDNDNALVAGQYQTFEFDNLKVRAFPAYNKNHPKDSCVGYILEFDGFKLYFSGDTSKIAEMSELCPLNIDYAFMCCDGFYNMSPLEAAECVKIINPRVAIPVHTSKNDDYDLANALKFMVPNRQIIMPYQEIELEH